MADRIHKQFFCDSHRAHSHAGFTDSQGTHSHKWIGPMDSQFTTHNSQFTNESQFTRESQRARATKPTTHWHHPITSRWGLGHERDELGPDPLEALPARLKWYTASDGFNRFPHSTGRLHPMGAETRMVVVGGGCLFDPLLGWLAKWFVVCVLWCVCVWLFAVASWLIC